MSIDWDAGLYDPLFSVFATAASLDIGGGPVAVTVIDQTAGIELAANAVDMPVISPVAIIRASEMASNDITEESLLEASLTIGSTVWTIKNVAARPGPGGKGSGEYMLVLINGDL